MRREFQFTRIQKTEVSTVKKMEHFIYELKPLVYLAISISVLNQHKLLGLWTKYAALGILFFAAYIILARLNNRGYF